jgi:predicted NBD/HSP70 family sugar kinase
MKTADPELMRAINRFHVMDAIRRFGPISRVEISDLTELSAATVSAITGLLLDDALIMPRPVGAVRDAARGRPRVMLELNPDAAHVAGVKLAPDQITVVVTNFRADVLRALSLPIRVDRQPASVTADLIEDGVRRAVADAGLTMGKVNGVCVGLPGVVERAAGRCRQSPILRERDVPLGPQLSARLAVPVTIDSDVNLVTLAEHWFGHGRGLSDFLVVSIEHSLGLGIMHNGELFRGANGLSPDLGDLIMHPSRGNGRNTPDRLAALVAVLRGDHEMAGGAGDEQGGADGRAIYADVAAALGIAIANLITLFAPPKVILAGTALSVGEALIGPLRAAVAEHTPPSLADVAEIVVDQCEDESWARGAAAMTLRDLYGAPWSTTGPALHR